MANEPKKGVDVAVGVVLGLLLPLLFILLPPAFFYVGAVEWLYLLPLSFVFWKIRRVGITQGLLIGGAVVLLLNAACFGIVLNGFS